VARAVTAKTDEWLAFVVIAFTCVSLLTALAVADDTAEATDNLLDVVQHQTQPSVSPNISLIREAARAVESVGASTFHWLCCITIGMALMLLSFELIRRER
jgi:hypothetical protein